MENNIIEVLPEINGVVQRLDFNVGEKDVNGESRLCRIYQYFYVIGKTVNDVVTWVC